MTAEETLVNVLGYSKTYESDTLVMFDAVINDIKNRVAIGSLIGVSYTLNGKDVPIYPFLLATCTNFMIEKGWVDLSKDIEFYKLK